MYRSPISLKLRGKAYFGTATGGGDENFPQEMLNVRVGVSNPRYAIKVNLLIMFTQTSCFAVWTAW